MSEGLFRLKVGDWEEDPRNQRWRTCVGRFRVEVWKRSDGEFRWCYEDATWASRNRPSGSLERAKADAVMSAARRALEGFEVVTEAAQ